MKTDTVNEMVDLSKKYSVIGIARLEGISASVLQRIRKSLGNEAEIKIARNTLKKIALTQSRRKNMKNFLSYVEDVGSCGLIFTDMNPFTLQRVLQANRIPSPARAGMVSPKDVIVPAQTTDLDPGPVIGELNSAGIRTRIEKGKIRITEDSLVIKAGETVTASKAAILLRLGILPFKAGLEIEAVWEQGDIIEGHALVVDTEATTMALRDASSHAISLALEIGYVTKETVPHLLSKAYMSALSLAIESNYLTAETIGLTLSKGILVASNLATKVAEVNPDAAPSGVTKSSETEKKETDKEEEQGEEEAGLDGLF